MDDGLEGQVAPLRVEGEFVNVHPAGADQHLVVGDLHVAQAIDGQVRTRGSFVLLRPVQGDRGDALVSQNTVVHRPLSVGFIPNSPLAAVPDSIPAGTHAGWATSSSLATHHQSPQSTQSTQLAAFGVWEEAVAASYLA